MEWCELNLRSRALLRHNDPSDDYCLPLHETFVLGFVIKPERQLIQLTISSAHFALNALRALETGWVIQLNGDATFGCRADSDVDMTELGFNSLGTVNNHACWSLISHQAEGEKTYTLTFYQLQLAVVSLFQANSGKKCAFTSFLLELQARPNMQKWERSAQYREGKLKVDTAQCDQLAGWACFTREVFGKDPNTCSNHLSGICQCLNLWMVADMFIVVSYRRIGISSRELLR